ncbi:MAG: FtsQ-type POTRA domain-containing protein [Prochloron sp. SP5CPC1]|nr:FtsQ-type POTRA domain-containing protein [Candidatus Paraprochloron terpiosi SP5CPC1]
MTSYTNSEDKTNWRSKLQDQLLMPIWRTLLVTGMTGCFIWGITLYDWTLYTSAQIQIEGDELLSKDGIRELIPLSYPKSLLRLSTEKLSQQLESTAPIAKALVTRQLIPPSLTIEIEERRPIAIVLSSKPSDPLSGQEELGFLDQSGIFLPKSFYTEVSPNFQLPTLKVTGYREGDRRSWFQIYQFVHRSTVEIFEVDWQNPSNLILWTELGKVYLGADISQIGAQLAVLAQMVKLPELLDPSKIDYLDLTNPRSPGIQLLQ